MLMPARAKRNLQSGQRIRNDTIIRTVKYATDELTKAIHQYALHQSTNGFLLPLPKKTTKNITMQGIAMA